MKRLRPLLAAAAAACLLPLAARAELPRGSLSFIMPTATVAPDEVIDVAMRLQLDDDSAPLVFSSDPLAGFDAADLPTQGNWFDPVTGAPELRDFASITGAFLNVYYACSGTFTAGDCGPGASYSFDFWFGGGPGLPSLVGVNSFDLAPGASTDFLLGRFTPQAGGAAAGSYSFYTAGVTLGFTGLDAQGQTLFSDGIDIASSCPLQTEDCAFVRTVSSVPEPGMVAMWLAGLASLGFLWRRRV